MHGITIGNIQRQKNETPSQLISIRNKAGFPCMLGHLGGNHLSWWESMQHVGLAENQIKTPTEGRMRMLILASLWLFASWVSVFEMTGVLSNFAMHFQRGAKHLSFVSFQNTILWTVVVTCTRNEAYSQGVELTLHIATNTSSLSCDSFPSTQGEWWGVGTRAVASLQRQLFCPSAYLLHCSYST